MDDFTIILLPDTQFYSSTYPEIFQAQTRWIADHRAELNIQMVIGLGDTVNSGSASAQWQNADAAMRTLDAAGVPYVMAIGNHDYDDDLPAGRGASNFNAYFGPQRYAGRSYYGGGYPEGSNENFYATFRAGGRDYLVLGLELFPRAAALEWAETILAANPEREVILVTHAYMDADRSRLGRCDKTTAESYGLGGDADGEELWEAFVRKHSAIRMVVSGHITGGAYRADGNANGDVVHQILADYQDEALGGGGYLRILQVRPATDTLDMSTYSPYLDAWRTDSDNRKTLAYHAQTSGTASAVQGVVRSIADCHVLSGVAVTVETAAATTDSMGNYAVALEAGTHSVTVKKSGWGSSTRTVETPGGFPASADFYLSTSGRVKGTVKDAAGQAVASAKVTFSGGAFGGTYVMMTGTTGAYSTGWIPTGDYWVTAEAAGYDPVTVRTTNIAGDTVLDLTVGVTTGRVSGRVTDASGALLANASVSDGATVATTDANGVYQLEVPAGQRTITASATGYLDSSATVTATAGAVVAADFTLRAAATTSAVQGRVTSAVDGLPLSGVSATCNGSVATTDGNGQYSLTGLAAGSCTLTVKRSGWGTQSRTVTLAENATTVADFQMATSGRFVGVVRAEDGSAAADATVTLRGGTVYTEKTVKTLADGSYASGWIAVGSYQVTASKEGYPSQTRTTQLSTGQTVVLDLVLTDAPPPEPPPPSCTAAATGVTICAPAQGAAASSPVRVNAAAASNVPVKFLQVYVDGKAVLTVNGALVDAQVAMAAGARNVTVQAKDANGVILKSTVSITVQ